MQQPQGGCSLANYAEHIVYGGSSGTEAEQAYYKAFAQKYEGVARWHEVLMSTAITAKVITLPSGRQYSFPNARRNKYGYVAGSTQIKNYPVQGFATADIVPLAVITIHSRFKREGLKSILINTVHDSIVVDAPANEVETAAKVMAEEMVSVYKEIHRRYGYTMKLALECEVKAGPNWLDGKVLQIA